MEERIICLDCDQCLARRMFGAGAPMHARMPDGTTLPLLPGISRTPSPSVRTPTSPSSRMASRRGQV